MENNKKNNINFTEELKYSLNIMHDQSKYAESKNTALIVFNSAVFVGIMSAYPSLYNLIYQNESTTTSIYTPGFLLFIKLLWIPLLASIICSLISYLPQIKTKTLDNKNNQNFLFFETNANIKSCSILYSCFKERYSDIDNYNLDISNQIHNLACITKRKYAYFNKALLILFIGIGIDLVISIIYVIILSLKK